ncbi:MAG: hypothetical protein V4510_02160 [bacterium]
MVPLRFPLSVAFLLLTVGTAAACPIGPGGCVTLTDTQTCITAQGAPKQITGSYDASTHTLTISWVADTGTTPDSYNVYRDDAKIGGTTTTSYADNLASLSGLHYYYVKAVTSGVESPQSDTLWLLKGGGVPPSVPCDPLTVSVFTYPPFLAYGVHDECLP